MHRILQQYASGPSSVHPPVPEVPMWQQTHASKCDFLVRLPFMPDYWTQRAAEVCFCAGGLLVANEALGLCTL